MNFVNFNLFSMQRRITDKKIPLTYEEMRKSKKVLQSTPFSSKTKRSTVVVEIEPLKKVRVYSKGSCD